MAKKKTIAPASVTGRDGYIVRQALLYAIAGIQALPEERQEWSNMLDMCLIVRANSNIFDVGLVESVEAHTGRAPDLWPEGDEYLSPEERIKRDQFNSAVVALKEQRRAAWELYLAANPEFGPSSTHGDLGEEAA